MGGFEAVKPPKYAHAADSRGSLVNRDTNI